MKDTVGFETTAIIDIDEQIRKREEALKEDGTNTWKNGYWRRRACH